MVDRDRARPPGQQEEEDRGPDEVLGPGAWVHENLDRGDHGEQREGRQTRREAEDEKGRAAELEGRGEDAGDLGRQHRNLVLVAEQGERGFPVGQLDQPGVEEDARDRQAKQELVEGQRESRQPPGAAGGAGPRVSGRRPGGDRRHAAPPPLGLCSSVTPTTSPSSRSARSAAERSNAESSARAMVVADSSVAPLSNAVRKPNDAASRRRIATASSRRRISSLTPPAVRSTVRFESASGWFAAQIRSTGHS